MLRADRRTVLKAALAAAAGGGWLPACAQSLAPKTGTQVVLLGTKGGPTPSPLRAQPANLLLVDGRPYVIDCGNGVATQLVRAGVALGTLDRVFLTHQHSDHNADLGNLLLLAWATNLKTPVHLYGPPPIAKMIDAFVAMNAIDLDVREKEEGRPPLGR